MTGRTRQLRIASAARLRSIRSVLRRRRGNQSAGSRSSATGSKECTYDRITHVEGLALLCSPTPRNESGLPGTQLLNSTLAGMLSSSTSTGATSRSRSGCPRGARWSSTSHRMPPRRATDHARGRSLGTASERAAAACPKGLHDTAVIGPQTIAQRGRTRPLPRTPLSIRGPALRALQRSQETRSLLRERHWVKAVRGSLA